MSERARFLLVFVFVVAIMAVVVTGVRGQESTTVFHESFDGAPDAPAVFAQDDWDIQYHSRAPEDWAAPRPMQGHHGPNCEAPLATHLVDTWPGSVYQCADHLMTASNGDGGYALTYLTPDHMVDWSNGEAVVRFDVSTFRTGYRDWIDVWITPWGDNMARPFDNHDVDLHGVPRNAIQVEMNSEGALCVRDFRDFEQVSPSPGWGSDSSCSFYTTLESVTGVPSDSEQAARQRETVEIRISASEVSVTLPEYSYTYDRYQPGVALPYSQGVVQFGHHSYTPSKDTNGPNTWHWDEIHIEPALPFTMVKADTAMVEGSGVVTFDAPGPADSHLRFAAVGDVQVSVDGGPFEPAQKQAFGVPEQEGFAHSYWHPVPEGTQQVEFALSGGWGGSQHMARDFALWSTSTTTQDPDTPTPAPTATAANTPAPTSTSTPTPSATPSPEPTATPTHTPTSTPTATPTLNPEPTATSTPTPMPTATPTTAPTATATPTPEPDVCHEAYFRNGVLTQGAEIPCP